MNMVEADLGRDGDEVTVVLAGHHLIIPEEVLSARPALMSYIGRRVALGIRPEDIDDAALVAGAEGSIVHLAVAEHEDMGSELLLYFDLDASPVLTQDMQSLAADQGADVLRSLEQQAMNRQARIAARVGSRSHARSGETAAVHVDMRNAHFFDLTTGDAIYGDRVAVGTTVSAAGGTEGR